MNYSSKVNLVSCAIEFAQTAVYASGNSSLSITNSNFYHNDLGVRIEGGVNLTRFSGNIIRGYPKYSQVHGYNVRYNGNSGHGMWINGNRLIVNLSSSRLSFNRFMHLESGVTITETNVHFSRTIITDIYTNRPRDYGFGVSIFGNNIKVNINGTGTNPTIKNFDTYGVVSWGNVNLEVNNCVIVRDIDDLSDRPSGTIMSEGIKLTANSNSTVIVENNVFRWEDNRSTFKTNSMIAANAFSNTQVRIYGNQFLDQTPTYTGLHTCVLLNSVQHGTSNLIQVNNNTIRKNLCYGIIFLGCRRASASNNTISNHQASKDPNVPVKAFVGVFANGGDNNTINSNAITDELILRDGSQFLHMGIFVSGSGDNRICNNILSSTEYGLYFQYVCNGSNALVGENRMFNHRFGLYYEPNVLHTQQWHTGNKWEGSYSNFAAEYLGPNFNLNQYFICQNPGNMLCSGYNTNLPYWPTSINQIDEWIADLNGAFKGCGNNSLIGWRPYILDTSIWIESGDGVVWTLHKGFVRDYIQQPDLQTDSLHTWFYNSIAMNGSLEFETLKADIGSSQKYQGVILSRIDSLKSLIVDMENTIMDLDSVIQEQEDPGDELFDSMLVLLGWHANLFDSIQILDDQEESRIMILKDTLLDRIVQLAPSCGVQSKDSAILALELKYIYGDTLSEAEIEFCQDLATSCYADWGDLIQRAYALLPTHLRNELTEYPGPCPLSWNALVVDSHGSISSTRIWPSPAQSEIILENPDMEISDILIMNSLGMICYKQSAIHNNQFNLDVSDLTEGIYIIQVKMDSGNTESHKIIIKR